jgi:hypothetical protein
MSEEKTYSVIETSGRKTIAQGMTTDAPKGLPAFPEPVKELMCIIMCACRKLFEANGAAPETTEDGETATPEGAAMAAQPPEPSIEKPQKRLQQNCVSTLFQTLDRQANYRSWIKAEVYFDMQGYLARFEGPTDRTSGQPQPLMSRYPATKPYSWFWGVINHVSRRKNPTLSQPTFAAGGISLRRPDIVVVRNPAQPPVEPNIAMIYELKFDQHVERKQIEAYELIVDGDKGRVQSIEIKDCKCDLRREKVGQLSESELMQWSREVNSAIGASGLFGKGDTDDGLAPEMAKTGLKVVGGIAIGVLAIVALPEEAVVATGAFIAMMLGVTGSANAQDKR